MSTGQKVTILDCPHCTDELALVELFDGRAFIKCKSGCIHAEIITALDKIIPPQKTPELRKIVSDKFFLDVIAYARSIGKAISPQDLKHELEAWKRRRPIKGGVRGE